MGTNKKYDLSWMEGTVESVPSMNWLYRICCILLFRKRMTYNELFMLLYGINKRALGEQDAKILAMNQVLKTYKHLNNNKLPERKYEDE